MSPALWEAESGRNMGSRNKVKKLPFTLTSTPPPNSQFLSPREVSRLKAQLGVASSASDTSRFPSSPHPKPNSLPYSPPPRPSFKKLFSEEVPTEPPRDCPAVGYFGPNALELISGTKITQGTTVGHQAPGAPALVLLRIGGGSDSETAKLSPSLFPKVHGVSTSSHGSKP